MPPAGCGALWQWPFPRAWRNLAAARPDGPNRLIVAIARWMCESTSFTHTRSDFRSGDFRSRLIHATKPSTISSSRIFKSCRCLIGMLSQSAAQSASLIRFGIGKSSLRSRFALPGIHEHRGHSQKAAVHPRVLLLACGRDGASRRRLLSHINSLCFRSTTIQGRRNPCGDAIRCRDL
jgi:hypothetical protein